MFQIGLMVFLMKITLIKKWRLKKFIKNKGEINMKKFEYLILEMPLNKEILNKLGEKGWEMIAPVSFTYSDCNYHFVFKREIE
jgi:hypothetical protein